MAVLMYNGQPIASTKYGEMLESSFGKIDNNYVIKLVSITPTSTADNIGEIGDTIADSNYIYIKTSGGWKRAALEVF